jgi:hypothetical protein
VKTDRKIFVGIFKSRILFSGIAKGLREYGFISTAKRENVESRMKKRIVDIADAMMWGTFSPE